MKNPVSERSGRRASPDFAEEATRRLLRNVDREARKALVSRDPEGVHRLRVAIRRFREAGALAKASLAPVEARTIRRRLKEILVAAGPVRNCDIARELIREEAPGRAAEWEPLLAREQTAARRHLTTLVERWLERKDARRWTRPGEEETKNAGGEDAPSRARARLARMTGDVLTRGRKAAKGRAPAKKLHRLRIATKRLRYALEVYAPLVGDGPSEFVEQLKRIQGWLGEANDCSTVARMADDWPESAALKKALKNRSRRNVEEFIGHWRRRFGSKAKRARWLDCVEGAGREAAPHSRPA